MGCVPKNGAEPDDKGMVSLKFSRTVKHHRLKKFFTLFRNRKKQADRFTPSTRRERTFNAELNEEVLIASSQFLWASKNARYSERWGS